LGTAQNIFNGKKEEFTASLKKRNQAVGGHGEVETIRKSGKGGLEKK